MILAGTGHRSDKIGGYNIPNPVYNYVVSEIERILNKEKPDAVISGMAIGYDTFLAETVLKLKIPLICAVPFKGQESIWPTAAQKKYQEILNQAAKVEYVSPEGYAAWKMHKRNQFMCEKCDKLLACFDGSKGGTYSCIQYAKSINKEIIRIDPTKYLDFKAL